MQTIPVEQAEGQLGEIIDRLLPGDEVVLTRNHRPVARLVIEAGERPHPVPGRGKGMLTIISEDDDHLKDFTEYIP
jgi:antitoxin (DNA-binding transcriptional repressor) of toxin-antitoxin stability system